MAIFNKKLKPGKKKPISLEKKPYFSLLAVILIIAYLSFILGRTLVKNIQIEKKINELKDEQEELEKENKYLTNLLVYFGTKSYKEKEARLRLNLKKEGETVVVVPKDTEEERKETEESLKEEENNDPNPLKWWNFLF